MEGRLRNQFQCVKVQYIDKSLSPQYRGVSRHQLLG